MERRSHLFSGRQNPFLLSLTVASNIASANHRDKREEEGAVAISCICKAIHIALIP